MATRRDVREAFYAALETAVDGLVPASNVSQEHPNSEEDLPAVVHNDNYRKVPMNRGASPTDIETDSDGNVTALVFTTMMQAQFNVTVLSDDESEKEDIYEAVRTHFEPYTHFKDTSQLQADVHRVEVEDVSSDDLTERDPTARADTLTINLGFERFYAQSVDHIDSIDQSIDVEDSIEEINNTIT